MNIERISSKEIDYKVKDNYYNLLDIIGSILDDDEYATIIGKFKHQWNTITLSTVIGRTRYYVTQASHRIGLRARRYLKYRPYARFLFWFIFRAMLPRNVESNIVDKAYKRNIKIRFRSWYLDTTYRQAYVLTALLLGYSRELIAKNLEINSVTLSHDLNYGLKKLRRRRDALSKHLLDLFCDEVYTPHTDPFINKTEI